MKKLNNKVYWFIWLVSSLGLVAYLGTTMLQGDDKTLFMPGPLTGGHHQIGIACDSCHTKAFTEKEDFQEACIECHGDSREKPLDSHPAHKFKDPRNASLLEEIDATKCITCHAEHRPELASKEGLTQPQDFCIHCHLEIGEERESHKDMDFMTCNDAGCHNYHNNRAIYTDFLLKHLNDPDIAEDAKLMQKDFSSRLEEVATYPHSEFPVEKLDASHLTELSLTKITDDDAHSEILGDWLTTKHSQSGVTCEACHLQEAPSTSALSKLNDEEKTTETIEKIWTDKPDISSCSSCHDVETKHFMQGKHGMRLKVGLPNMTPALARLPMHQDSLEKPLDCLSCHGAHKFDVQQAAVENCLGCHADEHSLAYKESPHAELWEKELSGELPEGSGVSCASCHMPRVEIDVSEWMERVVVMHNQNATLVPNEKMIRPSCLECHGLEFSINALSDEELVKKNFKGVSTFKTDSMRLVDEEQKRYEEKRKNKN